MWIYFPLYNEETVNSNERERRTELKTMTFNYVAILFLAYEGRYAYYCDTERIQMEG